MMTKILKYKLTKGSSILEIIATICVLSIGLLAVYSLFILSIQTTRKSHYFTLAYQSMNQAMEEVRATPFNNIISPSTSTTSVTGLPEGTLMKTIAIYNSDNNVKIITIQVQWVEQGNSRSITETTLATLGGIND